MTTECDTLRPLGGQVSDDVLRADLERYRQRALELGATDAVVIPADWIDVTNGCGLAPGAALPARGRD
jgi:hypothetical protein